MEGFNFLLLLDEADELQWMARGYQKVGGIIWFAFWIFGTARLYKKVLLLSCSCNMESTQCDLVSMFWQEIAEKVRQADASLSLQDLPWLKKKTGARQMKFAAAADVLAWKWLSSALQKLCSNPTLKRQLATNSFPCCPLPCRQILKSVGSWVVCPWRATRVPCKAEKTGGWVAQRVTR